MSNTVRLVDGATTVWLRPENPSIDDAIYCVSHELSKAEPRVVSQPRAGRSGQVDTTLFHDGAQWQGSLAIFDGGGLTRHQWVDRLSAILQPWNRPYLYIQRDGWLSERRALVRGAEFTKPITSASGAYLETSLVVSIPDGVLESATQSTDSTRPASVSNGRTYPKSYPWSYTAGTSGAVKDIVVGGGEEGAAPVPLLMRLYGDCTDPTITNVTLGRSLSLTGVSIAAGSYLEIDMSAKTIFLNGDPSLSYYNRIDFTVSDWWELLPGTNELQISTATVGATCELIFFWYDRFAI